MDTQYLKKLIEKVNLLPLDTIVSEELRYSSQANKGRLLLAWEFVESYYCDDIIAEQLGLNNMPPAVRFTKASLLAWYEIESLELKCTNVCQRCN